MPYIMVSVPFFFGDGTDAGFCAAPFAGTPALGIAVESPQRGTSADLQRIARPWLFWQGNALEKIIPIYIIYVLCGFIYTSIFAH